MHICNSEYHEQNTYVYLNKADCEDPLNIKSFYVSILNRATHFALDLCEQMFFISGLHKSPSSTVEIGKYASGFGNVCVSGFLHILQESHIYIS